jgi:pyruvate,orthophosphate dikinase
MRKYVYFFGNKKGEGGRENKEILGGKGANLHEMCKLGLPIPPGFTISTEICKYYYQHNKTYPKELEKEVKEGIKWIEGVSGRKFGSPTNPLLLSVRSGARVSMPGMMDTILNIGLNSKTIKGLIKQGKNPGFAYDCERRLIEMYGGVVLGVQKKEFENLLKNKLKERKVISERELLSEDWMELIEEYKKVVQDFTYKPFPEDVYEQLWGAIRAVLESWNSERAIEYRKFYNIPDDWGTAVNVQAMVYGNMDRNSATGVAFTRNPATGENFFYGEWLPDAQGEDVVAGIRTPLPLNIIQKEKGRKNLRSLEEELPQIYKELLSIRKKLEIHYKEMQDIEFTLENGKLWILQTRTGKRTSMAAVKIVVDMVEEGLITKEEAIMRIKDEDINTLLHPMLSPYEKYNVIAVGLGASPGAVSGEVVFTPKDAVELKKKNRKTILVRVETSPEDIAGMKAAEGILTQKGGMTSHAAVVARGMGKPCIVGCESITVDYEKEEFRVKDIIVKKGEIITIGGATGRVILGEVPKIMSPRKKELEKLLSYANEIRKLKVLANADTPESAKLARKFGAEGIGLCRTEHMFFEKSRINSMRKMILAQTKRERKEALLELLPMQREDFKKIFREMNGFPVIIRTLDPPLHEFLSYGEERIVDLAKKLNITVEKLKERMESLREINPMLGWRGCRLGISYPEITEIQVQAIFEAVCEVKEERVEIIPKIMIPLVAEAEELVHQRKIIERVARQVKKERKINFSYEVGTMIEIPRAALTADKIAKVADFFSFGTNDLTQTTFGFSRDDIGKILPDYVEKGILRWDPFQRLDEEGVGKLIQMTVKLGKKVNPNLEIGICGEHGGEPHSIEFCHKVGLDYVSCSPYRIPIAQLASAQAVVKSRKSS